MSGWGREGCRITASLDLNTLFPASANLFASMANKIDDRRRNGKCNIVRKRKSFIAISRPRECRINSDDKFRIAPAATPM